MNSKKKYLDLLRTSDLLILSTESEGFPRVIWEAMSQSLPIISSDLYNIKKEFEDYPGIIELIPNNSPQILCNKIEKLLNNPEMINHQISISKEYITNIFNEFPSEQVYRLISKLNFWQFF